jgi:phage terminase Nu1 subunit (DNA packaging protein)
MPGETEPTKTPLTSTDAAVNGSELSALTGLTDMHHRRLAKEGWFAAPVSGKYQLAATIRGLIRYYREGFRAKARSELDVERARESRVRADIMELDRSHKSGLLIASDTALSLVRSSFQPVRDALLSLPAAMSARVNPADPPFAREALTQWVDDTLRLCREHTNGKNGHAVPAKKGRHFGSPKKAVLVEEAEE